jgi:hypothetical protein
MTRLLTVIMFDINFPVIFFRTIKTLCEIYYVAALSLIVFGGLALDLSGRL